AGGARAPAGGRRHRGRRPAGDRAAGRALRTGRRARGTVRVHPDPRRRGARLPRRSGRHRRMTARYDSGPRDAGSRGIALLAVLVALSLLLALAAPFLSSMGNGDQAARAAVDEKRVAWESASVRELLIAKAARSASAVDR